jgi:hypothetical protein
MNKALPILTSFIVFQASLLTLAPPVHAQDDWGGDCVIGDVATIRGISCLISNMLSASLSLLGLLFFLMLLVGGFKYLTSGGDPKGVDSAKGTITAALVAIFLVIIGWFGLRLIAEITGIDILNLRFPFAD